MTMLDCNRPKDSYNIPDVTGSHSLTTPSIAVWSSDTADDNAKATMELDGILQYLGCCESLGDMQAWTSLVQANRAVAFEPGRVAAHLSEGEIP